MYVFLVLGPPHVALDCLADYVALDKIIKVSWKPSFLINDTSITSEDVIDHIQNCLTCIICNNGYTKKVSSTLKLSSCVTIMAFYL